MHIRLFPFPPPKRRPQDRERWLKTINRADPQKPYKWLQPSKDQVVCSSHFVDGKPTSEHPDPEMLLNKKETSTPECSARKVRTERRQEYHKKELEAEHYSNVPDSDMSSSSTGNTKSKDSSFLYLKFLIVLLLSLVRRHKQDNERLRQHNMRLRKQLKGQKGAMKNQNQTLYASLIKSNKDLNFFTGIHCRDLFSDLHDYISGFVRRRWRGIKCVVTHVRKYTRSPKKFGPNRKLNSIDKFLLTLMKLCLGLLNKDLAKRFNISPTLTSNIFHSWLAAMNIVMDSFLRWPTKDEVAISKPSHFACLPNIRAIIDCTEIFIETPKDPNLQNITWSNYKHDNTAKILVACAPNSSITFLSSSYGGRASDKNITIDSGFLDKLDQHDLLQADKGFNIMDECASRMIHLQVPPGLRGEVQMSSKAVQKTKKVANLRILIEQVIRQIKSFRILSGQLPVTLVPSLNKIVRVCSALVNLKRLGPYTGIDMIIQNQLIP